MTTANLSFDEFMAAAIATGAPLLRIEKLAAAHPDVIDKIRGFDPFRLAATFGALLTVPDLQSSCVRLEALVHLSVFAGAGKRKPQAKLIQRCFTALGTGDAGMMEDPAEEVFVTSVATSRGNFRVLEGIWEGAGFFLQRFLDAVERMPAGTGYDEMRASIFALLKLSDAVCERASLKRWQAGNERRLRTMPSAIAASAAGLRARICFTETELEEIGIPLEPLSQFFLLPRERHRLASEEIGRTTLERYPLLWRDRVVCLALPTAVSAAIRRLIIERMIAAGMREPFLKGLANEYTRIFEHTPLLGGALDAPVHFQRLSRGMAASVMTGVDEGRYLNFVFIMDTLEGFEDGGLNSLNEDLKHLGDKITKWNESAASAAEGQGDFREGIILIVSCGIGRPIAASLPLFNRPGWRQEFVSAPDLLTLSWTSGFKPIALWRLLDAQQQVEDHGVYLQNANGLLNLVAWQRSLRGHLVPHDRLPADFIADGHQSILMIEQNALKTLRQEVAQSWDPHVVLDADGRWVRIRKLNESVFPEDAARPIYATDGKPLDGGPPRLIYLAENRAWWCQLEVTEKTAGAMSYERWKMLSTWLERLAPVLDKNLPDLPATPVLWHVSFEADLTESLDIFPQIGLDEAKQAIAVVVDAARSTVELHVGAAYEGAHFNPDNIAERALIERTVDGFAELTNRKIDDTERATLLAAIIPDRHARQTHAFRGRGYRDHVREPRRRSVTLINHDDDAALRLGLGWRVRAREDGSDIRGKPNCTSFLNAVVQLLENELCSDLAVFNRVAMIRALLYNHELAAIDRDRWHRTASAVVALRSDKLAAFETIADHESRLNAVFQATRTLIEIACCACPPEGGYVPGKLELSRLMAKMASIIHIGGWSDAIWLDTIEPRLRISPLGDIQLNTSFLDDVIAPFGRAASDVRTKDAIENYAKHLEDVPPRESIEEMFEPEFLVALTEELGASLDDIRLFIDYVEDLGVKQDELVLTIQRSRLLTPALGEQILPREKAEALVNALTLPARPNWRDVPNGYEEKDRQPWRYRRRLSVLRKPLVQFDDALDPTIMVAPGLLRDGLIYAIGNHHRGDFPQWQLMPKMRSWRGKSAGKREEFNTTVAERLKELGWLARPNVNMSAILGSAFKPYGDIDVLAWKATGDRVLLMECKDLKFSKTLGEISEQLGDFRGELHANGKPDDLLRHLNRVDAIRSHPSELARYLGLDFAPAPEGHVVFRNPVPMQFVWERLKPRVGLHLFDTLNRL
jgi:hypothetical protein